MTDFECSPEQVAAGISKLWDMLGNPKEPEADVFTLIVAEVERLRAVVAILSKTDAKAGLTIPV